MAKKNKRSEVSGAYTEHMATGLTAEERATQNKKANAERAHGGTGEDITSTPLSHFAADGKRGGKGLNPEERAKKRGNANVPKVTRGRTTKGY